MRSEEDGRPSEVEKKLDNENPEGCAFPKITSKFLPDEREAHADHGVESSPDGAEDPVRRSSGRVVERLIPEVNRAYGEEGSKPPKALHHDDTEDDL